MLITSAPYHSTDDVEPVIWGTHPPGQLAARKINPTDVDGILPPLALFSQMQTVISPAQDLKFHGLGLPVVIAFLKIPFRPACISRKYPCRAPPHQHTNLNPALQPRWRTIAPVINIPTNANDDVFFLVEPH